MRYVAEDNLQLPEGWVERAEAAKEALLDSAQEDRPEIMNRNSAIWRDVRRELAKLSNGKCWYCETKEPRSDRVVDHFRPKNRVAERNDHPGYWWLAFDLGNYRYSCTFCNSLRRSEDDATAGGKADHFPIVDETRRALDPSDPIQDELPYLLDPRSVSDPLLLTFQDDGRAVPRYDNDEDSLHYKRADVSIQHYHLNHPEIREARFAVCDEVKKLIGEGDRAFVRQEENPQAALVGRESFDGIVRRIRLMVDKDAEYSRAARAILTSYRTMPWVESILEDSN